MSVLEIALIGIGLAMDAFAVAICKGLSMKKIDWKKALIIALYFGFFQAIMPVIGYFLGTTFESFVVQIDHWIAFFLLAFIGGNMIKESFDDELEKCNDDVSFKTMIILAIATTYLDNTELIILSIATSIDALAVGITFALLRTHLILSVVTIGTITFGISLLGVKIGNKFGNKYQNKAEFTGGLLLILLGTKILLEHLGFLPF